MIPVIICGGVGTKMWPESRRSMPKHFLKLVGEKSLFQLNYEILRQKFEAKDIYIQTNEAQAKVAMIQVPELIRDNIFVEPELRNQGPATGLMAASLYKKGLADEPFMLIQVDDLREPVENYLSIFDICDRLARETDKYITGGFRPSFGVMGVDYLIKGDRLIPDNKVGVYKVDKFLWRGSKESAEGCVQDGRALLHANHTCMTPRNFMKMFAKYRPDWHDPLMNYINGAELSAEYLKMPAGPLEEVTQLVYAAGEALVVELPFEWIDFGTWESLEKYEVKKVESLKSKSVIEIDSKDNYVRAKKVVAIVGVDNLVVVDTPDGLLICRRDLSGKVGETVAEMGKRGLTGCL